MRSVSTLVHTLALATVVVVGAYAGSYRSFVDYMIRGSDPAAFCEQCETVLQLLKDDPDGTLDSALNACRETEYFTPRICTAEYMMYNGSIKQILKELVVPLDEVCRFLGRGSCGPVQSDLYNWTLELADIKDDDEFPPEYFQHHEAEWGHTHMSILQVTDTHFDEDYEVGADSRCNEPICCTKYQNQTSDPERFAGPWGHPGGGRCDIPMRTVENMFRDIDRSRHVSFGVFTGDISSHSYLNATNERAFRDIQESTAVIKRYLRGVRMFPALGNHDYFPQRLFPQPEVDAGDFSASPLYEEMWNLWYDWLPPDQEKNFKHGGFYTAKAHKYLRIVALNTNFCYEKNWWLVLGANDPADQLRWLIATLNEARQNRERVFIIGHIPPGFPDCNQFWEEAYFKIVTKFRKTISAQLFAHTHSDLVVLDYNDPLDASRATTVLYVAPSVSTSWSGMPEYRIYQTEMGEIVDVETYFLNLTVANSGYFRIRDSVHEKVRKDFAKGMTAFRRRAMERVLYGDPHWELGYSARKSYGLRKFDAVSWAKLVHQLKTDDQLLQTFYKHHVQFRPSVVASKHACDEKCRDRLIKMTMTRRSAQALAEAATRSAAENAVETELPTDESSNSPLDNLADVAASRKR